MGCSGCCSSRAHSSSRTVHGRASASGLALWLDWRLGSTLHARPGPWRAITDGLHWRGATPLPQLPALCAYVHCDGGWCRCGYERASLLTGLRRLQTFSSGPWSAQGQAGSASQAPERLQTPAWPAPASIAALGPHRHGSRHRRGAAGRIVHGTTPCITRPRLCHPTVQRLSF